MLTPGIVPRARCLAIFLTMKKRLALLLPTLLVIAAPAFGQSVQTKWVPLPMDLPKQVLSAISTGPKNPADILHISINMPFRDPYRHEVIFGFRVEPQKCKLPALPDSRASGSALRANDRECRKDHPVFDGPRL